MLILIRGLPGSGKTTFVNKELRKDFPDIRQFEADMYFLSAKGEYLFDPRKLGAAHAWCLNSTKKALARGETVAVSNTFCSLWEMDKYFQLAKELKVDIQVFHLKCSFETSVKRNNHQVPAETIKKMISRWEEVPNEVLKSTD